MTKNTISRPTIPARPGGAPRPADDGAQQAPADQGGARKPSSSSKSTGPTLASRLRQQALKKSQGGKKPDKVKAAKGPKVSRPRGAHGAHAAGGHDDHHDDGEAHGLGGVEGASNEDELHRRRHVEVEYVHEDEEIEEHEELHDTAAVGADAVKRGQNDGGGDGFEGGGDKQREAYERYMRGNVKSDKERFDELRQKGTRDDFNPDLQPREVEALGTTRATAHLVRSYEKWTLEGASREEAVRRAAALLSGFSQVTNIRKVLAELESKPIRDVYPLEVLLRILEERPEVLPGVRPGAIIGNAADLKDGRRVLAGVPAVIPLPGDVRLKSFALLGGGRPGYEFAPHASDEGKYTLLIDTPGRWTFAVLAAPLQQLGRIQRETSEAILELFTVAVHAMGVKGEPLTPEQWEEEQRLAGTVDDAADDDDDDGGSDDDAAVATAPPLPVQIRRALESIARDDDEGGAAATTYSWDARFYKPGAAMTGDGILHLVVTRAGPFDAGWVKAREALAAKQKEHEPGRAVVTQEDFTAALRRARVR